MLKNLLNGLSPCESAVNFDFMKKNLFLVIIIFNSIALLGILLTQIYWVRESYRMQEDQFAGTIRITIKGLPIRCSIISFFTQTNYREGVINDSSLYLPT